MNTALDQEAVMASMTSHSCGIGSPPNTRESGAAQQTADSSTQEQRHLLSTAIDTMGPVSQTAANYGALNTSRLNSQNGDDCDKSVLHDVTCSELDSSMLDCSQMGESVRYREHVSQYTRERAGELLLSIKDRVTFFGMSVLVLIPATLLANGVGHFISGTNDDQPMVVRNGCNIGLDKWYIFLTVMACAKLLIEVWRYMYVKINFQESLALHIGGNLICMPIAFLVFFVTTQQMWERANPDPERILSYREAQGAQLESNECVQADTLSQSLYSTFQIVSVLSYLVCFYYIVGIVVVAQSVCLIKAIVQRRINLMRRRDLEEERNNGEGEGREPMTLSQFQEEMEGIEQEEGGNLFIEGMFGGLLTIPLPVPEIISSLNKTKFKHKQSQQKKKSGGAAASESGLWRQCPICWSDFLRNDFVTTLHCDEKHIFHTDCIEQWIRKGQNSCPLCRQTIANL